MNILITGASGFIGFHLALALKKLNHFVIGLDNFNDYYDVNLKKDRESILNQNDINIINGDISNSSLITKILKKNDITHVVNLAAQAGVRYSITHPDLYLQTNIIGFTHLLEACKNFKDIKVVYASSSSVYGSNKKIPFSINDKTDFPSNLYGATKKSNELIANVYHEIYNLKLIGLRFFTVYGPYGRPDMAYYKFTKNILNDIPIDVYNEGKMQRDFTYIDDIISGTIKAIEKDEFFGIYNLGNSSPVNLLSFIQTLENKLNKKAILNLLPMQKGEVLETYADISKSIQDLDFNPKTSLDKGLDHFLNWYMKYHKK